jgi:hypothetical protein
MKKTSFIHLIAGTISGLLFALGMCMCLLPEWNAFQPGVICTAVGAVSLLIQGVVAWIHSGRKVKVNWKIAGKVLYGVFASLVLGVGMCLIMVWQKLLLGILVGIAGIILFLMLIPICIGLK